MQHTPNFPNISLLREHPVLVVFPWIVPTVHPQLHVLPAAAGGQDAVPRAPSTHGGHNTPTGTHAAPPYVAPERAGFIFFNDRGTLRIVNLFLIRPHSKRTENSYSPEHIAQSQAVATRTSLRLITCKHTGFLGTNWI